MASHLKTMEPQRCHDTLTQEECGQNHGWTLYRTRVTGPRPEAVLHVEDVRDRVVVIGLLETLEYLVRGGRLSAAAGAVGTLLNVKPVVAVEDGLIVQLGKARGSKNGRNLLNQKVEKAGGIDFSMPLALGYTGLSDAVLKKYIEDSAALWAGHAEGELPVYTIGATIGTHVGPGAVAVAFFQPAN